MIGITPVDIFPLNYPSGDTTIPSRGAKAVPFILDWSKDNQYDANLLQVRDQKFFGSLRCLWIDASECIQNFTVAVNGTEQIFTIVAGTSAYYPVVNLNVPVITFLMASKESTLARIICLNFVPSITTPSQITFPSSMVVSGDVAVTNFPGTYPVTGTFWQPTQPVSLANPVSVLQTGVWNVGIIGTSSTNINEWGGSATSLGQKTSAASLPSVLASDQSTLNITSNVAVLGTASINSTTSINIISSTSGVTFIRTLTIFSMNAVLSTGSVQVQIKDGVGSTMANINLQLPTATGFAAKIIDNESLNIACNVTSNPATVALNANLTSGFIIVSIGGARI